MQKRRFVKGVRGAALALAHEAGLERAGGGHGRNPIARGAPFGNADFAHLGASAHPKTRKAARRERKAAAAAIAASAAAVAGGRAKLPAGSAFGRVPVPAGHPVFPAVTCGDPRHVPALRGLGADGKASRGAKLKGQEAPQHLGFFWHGTRLNAAQRGVDRKTNETVCRGRRGGADVGR